MSAQRKLIRQVAAAYLLNNTDAGANVFPSRSKPLWQDYELPAISVYGTRETMSLLTEAPRQYKRELELRFEVVATGEDADDQLDDIGDRIERIIGRSNCLEFANESVVSDILLTGDQIEYRQEGDKIVGALIKTYNAIYITEEPDDLDVEPIDELHSVMTDYSLSNSQDPAERASDLVEGLEA